MRSAFFAQNFSEDMMVDAVCSGVLPFPAGEVTEPFIDVDDIADVATATLTEDGHGGQIYEVTGPRLMTFADAVGEIAVATGRQIRYQHVSSAAMAEGMVEAGWPAELAGQLTALFDEVLDGRNAHLSDGVHRALGRAPRDFTDYARAAAATGVWAG